MAKPIGATAPKVIATASNNKNPFITAQISKSSIRTTLISLTAEMTGMRSRAEAAIHNSALNIQRRARANVKPFRYDNRLHDAIQVRVSKRGTPLLARVTVGIHSDTFAPEGATFERGWKSKRGLRPPIEPLAIWAARRFARNYSDATSAAFAISRYMGEHGYTFKKRPWLRPAFEAEKGLIEPTVARFMMTGVGRPPLAGSYRLPAEIIGGESWGDLLD